MDQDKNRPVTYSATSRLRHPATFASELWGDLISARGVIYQMFIRGIKARYRESFLGVVWSFLPPLLLAAGFMVAERSRLVNLGSFSVPYPFYVLSGAIFWQFFTDCIVGPFEIIRDSKAFLTRIKVNSLALIASRLFIALFDLGIKLLLLIPMSYFFKADFGTQWAWLPAAILALWFLGAAIGMFLMPFCTIFGDMQKLVSSVLSYGIFLVPVTFQISPATTLGRIMLANPVTALIVTARESIIAHAISMPETFWYVSGASFVLFVLGFIYCSLATTFVVERMGS